MAKESSVWRHLEQFPPMGVRLMARDGRGRGTRALTVGEIAARSGLSVRRVLELEQMADWSEVKVAEMRDFFRGCQFDPLSAADRRDKFKTYLGQCTSVGREPWSYLRNDPRWPEYQKLIASYMKYLER